MAASSRDSWTSSGRAGAPISPPQVLLVIAVPSTAILSTTDTRRREEETGCGSGLVAGYQLHHHLHVAGLGKEVDQVEAFDAVDRVQEAQVPRQGGSIAGDVGQAAGAASGQGLADLAGEAGARRVDDHPVRTLRQRRDPGLDRLADSR